MPIVTLLTDYGVADTYVAQVKGAIFAINPTAVVVDLTHSVPPQDIRAGAFLLWTAVETFPAGSIHVGIVDPGVGTQRRAVAVQSARGDLFVGPDNGLLVPAIERLGGATCVVELTEPSFWRSPLSATFHGRDVFGPVAAHLLQGVPLRRLGNVLHRLERPFLIPRPRPSAEGLRGQVIHVDAFGNLVTNLPEAGGDEFTLLIKGQRISGRRGAPFASVAPGRLLSLVGSAGLLEIAVRDGSAAAILGARAGDAVTLLGPPSEPIAAH